MIDASFTSILVLMGILQVLISLLIVVTRGGRIAQGWRDCLHGEKKEYTETLVLTGLTVVLGFLGLVYLALAFITTNVG